MSIFWDPERKNPFSSIRLIAIFVLFCFTTTSVAWSAPSLNTAYSVRRTEIPGYSLAEKISIPAELGTIKEVYSPSLELDAVPSTPSAAPVIIHLEDAHGSLDAQLHEEKILRHLQEQFGFNTFFVEGGLGDLRPELLQFFKDSELNGKLIDKLTEIGLVGGVERFLSTEHGGRSTAKESAVNAVRRTPFAVRAFGVESVELYRRELKLFREVYKRKAESDKFLGEMRQALLAQSASSYNKELKTFFREWLFQEEIQRNILSHLSFLQKSAKETLNLDLVDAREQYDWPMLVRFCKLQSLEKSTGNAERKAVNEKENLFRWLKANNLEEFKATFDSFVGVSRFPVSVSREGDIRSRIERFYEAAAPKGFKFSDYPALSKRIGIVILGQEIQTEELLREMERLNEKILEALAKTPEEKLGVARYQEYLTLRKLLSLELTRKEYQRLQDSLRGTENGERITKSFGVSPSSFPVKDALEFYQVAKDREEAMFSNMLKTMKARGEPNAVLVTGGFHSEGLAEFFKEKGLSYVRIAPRISGKVDDANYLRVMALGRSASLAASHARPPSVAGSLLKENLPEYFTFYRDEIRSVSQDLLGRQPETFQRPGLRPGVEKVGESTRSEVREAVSDEGQTLHLLDWKTEDEPIFWLVSPWFLGFWLVATLPQTEFLRFPYEKRYFSIPLLPLEAIETKIAQKESKAEAQALRNASSLEAYLPDFGRRIRVNWIGPKAILLEMRNTYKSERLSLIPLDPENPVSVKMALSRPNDIFFSTPAREMPGTEILKFEIQAQSLRITSTRFNQGGMFFRKENIKFFQLATQHLRSEARTGAGTDFSEIAEELQKIVDADAAGRLDAHNKFWKNHLPAVKNYLKAYLHRGYAPQGETAQILLLQAIAAFRKLKEKHAQAKRQPPASHLPKETAQEKRTREAGLNKQYLKRIKEILETLKNPDLAAKVQGPPSDGLPQFDEPQVRKLHELEQEEIFTASDRKELDDIFSRFNRRMTALGRNTRSEIRGGKEAVVYEGKKYTFIEISRMLRDPEDLQLALILVESMDARKRREFMDWFPFDLGALREKIKEYLKTPGGVTTEPLRNRFLQGDYFQARFKGPFRIGIGSAIEKSPFTVEIDTSIAWHPTMKMSVNEQTIVEDIESDKVYMFAKTRIKGEEGKADFFTEIDSDKMSSGKHFSFMLSQEGASFVIRVDDHDSTNGTVLSGEVYPDTIDYLERKSTMERYQDLIEKTIEDFSEQMKSDEEQPVEGDPIFRYKQALTEASNLYRKTVEFKELWELRKKLFEGYFATNIVGQAEDRRDYALAKVYDFFQDENLGIWLPALEAIAYRLPLAGKVQTFRHLLKALRGESLKQIPPRLKLEIGKILAGIENVPAEQINDFKVPSDLSKTQRIELPSEVLERIQNQPEPLLPSAKSRISQSAKEAERRSEVREDDDEDEPAGFEKIPRRIRHASRPSRENLYSNFFDRAKQKMKERDFPNAAILLNRVIRKEPRLVFAHILLGQAYLNLSNMREALEVSEKALSLIREGVERKDARSLSQAIGIYGVMMHAWISLNELEKARDAAQKARDLEPKNPEALRHLAAFYLKTAQNSHTREAREFFLDEAEKYAEMTIQYALGPQYQDRRTAIITDVQDTKIRISRVRNHLAVDFPEISFRDGLGRSEMRGGISQKESKKGARSDFEASVKGKNKRGVNKWELFDAFKAQLSQLPLSIIAELRKTEDIGRWRAILIGGGIAITDAIAGKFLDSAVRAFLEKNRPGIARKIDNRLRFGGQGRYLKAYLGDAFDYIVKMPNNFSGYETVRNIWIGSGFRIAQQRLKGYAVPTLVFDASDGKTKPFVYHADGVKRNKTELALVQPKVERLIDKIKNLSRNNRDSEIEEAKAVIEKFKKCLIGIFRRGVIDSDFGGELYNYGVDNKTGEVFMFDFGDLTTGYDMEAAFFNRLYDLNMRIEEDLEPINKELWRYYHSEGRFVLEDFVDEEGNSLFGIDYGEKSPTKLMINSSGLKTDKHASENKAPSKNRAEFIMTFPLAEDEIREMFANHQVHEGTQRSEVREQTIPGEPSPAMLALQLGAISLFAARDFTFKNLEKKITALLAYKGKESAVVGIASEEARVIHHFVYQAVREMADTAWNRKWKGHVLGLAGEISGIFQVVIQKHTSLNYIDLGRLRAFHQFVRDGSRKEFDAVSDKTVFEFKFHANLLKLYEQVVGLQGLNKTSHMQILVEKEAYQNIRNLVYFGEADQGYLVKALAAYLGGKQGSEGKPTVEIEGDKNVSVKFSLGQLRSFLRDPAVLRQLQAEAKSYHHKLDLREIKLAEWIDLKEQQIRALPAKADGTKEKFDVILSVSNATPWDIKALQKAIAPSSDLSVSALRSEMRMRLSMELRPIQTQSLQLSQKQRIAMKQMLALLMKQEAEDPVPPAAAKGIEALHNADRILKSKKAVGIVIGSVAKDLWNRRKKTEDLFQHGDLDVAVLTPGFLPSEPFEGGVDWWIPEAHKIRIAFSDATVMDQVPVTAWINGNGAFLRTGINSFDLASVSPGLYLPSREFLINLTKQSVLNAFNLQAVTVDSDVLDAFSAKLDRELGRGLSPVWKKDFGGTENILSSLAVDERFGRQEAVALQKYFRDTGRRQYEKMLDDQMGSAADSGTDPRSEMRSGPADLALPSVLMSDEGEEFEVSYRKGPREWDRSIVLSYDEQPIGRVDFRIDPKLDAAILDYANDGQNRYVGIEVEKFFSRNYSGIGTALMGLAFRLVQYEEIPEFFVLNSKADDFYRSLGMIEIREGTFRFPLERSAMEENHLSLPPLKILSRSEARKRKEVPGQMTLFAPSQKVEIDPDQMELDLYRGNKEVLEGVKRLGLKVIERNGKLYIVFPAPGGEKNPEMEFRAYQVMLAAHAISRDALTVLPTGLGKTNVAMLVIRYLLEKEKAAPDFKIVMTAPTVVLAHQHLETLSRFFPGLPIGEITAGLSPVKRQEAWKKSKIVLMTNEMIQKSQEYDDERRIPVEEAGYLIVDEVHKARKEHAMVGVIRQFRSKGHAPASFLGLTATPDLPEGIESWQEKIGVKPEGTFVASWDDPWVHPYIWERIVEKNEVVFDGQNDMESLLGESAQKDARVRDFLQEASRIATHESLEAFDQKVKQQLKPNTENPLDVLLATGIHLKALINLGKVLRNSVRREAEFQEEETLFNEDTAELTPYEIYENKLAHLIQWLEEHPAKEGQDLRIRSALIRSLAQTLTDEMRFKFKKWREDGLRRLGNLIDPQKEFSLALKDEDFPGSSLKKIPRELPPEIREKYKELRTQKNWFASRQFLYKYIYGYYFLWIVQYFQTLIEQYGPIHLFKGVTDLLNKENEKQAWEQLALPALREAKVTLYADWLEKERIEHPKLEKLLELLTEGAKAPDYKGIVFVENVYAAQRIKEAIEKRYGQGVAGLLIGKAPRQGIVQTVQMDRGDQTQAVEDFKQGKFKFLVATQVGEEGLDIPNVNQVVFYEPVSDHRRFVQRMGRTGRHKAGRVNILVTQGTLEETKFWAAQNRARRVQQWIRAQQLLNSYVAFRSETRSGQIVNFEGETFDDVWARWKTGEQAGVPQALWLRDPRQWEDNKEHEYIRALEGMTLADLQRELVLKFGAEDNLGPAAIEPGYFLKHKEPLKAFLSFLSKGSLGKQPDNLQHHLDLPRNAFLREFAKEKPRYIRKLDQYEMFLRELCIRWSDPEKRSETRMGVSPEFYNEHRSAYFQILRELAAGHLPFGLPLVFFDQHSDTAGIKEHQEAASNNWVTHLLRDGLVSNIFWVYPAGRQVSMGREWQSFKAIGTNFKRILEAYAQEFSKGVILSFDLDYFASTGVLGTAEYHPPTGEISRKLNEIFRLLGAYSIPILLINAATSTPIEAPEKAIVNGKPVNYIDEFRSTLTNLSRSEARLTNRHEEQSQGAAERIFWAFSFFIGPNFYGSAIGDVLVATLLMAFLGIIWTRRGQDPDYPIDAEPVLGKTSQFFRSLEVRLFKRLLLRGTRIAEFVARVFEKHTDGSEKQKISSITEDPAALLSLMIRPSRKNLQRILTERGVVLSSEQVRGILAEVKEFKNALRTINPIYFLTGSDKNVFRVLRKIIKALTVSAAKRIKRVPSPLPVSTETPDRLTGYLKKLGVKENSLEQARIVFDIRSKIGALHKKAIEEDSMAFVYITGDSKVGKTTFINFAKEGLSAVFSDMEYLSMDEVYEKYGDEFSSGEDIRDYLFRKAKNQGKRLVVVEGVKSHSLARTGDLNFIIQLRANYATRLENILREEASLDLLWSKNDAVDEAVQVDLSRSTRPYREHIRSIFALTNSEVDKLSASSHRSEMREDEAIAELLKQQNYKAVTDRLILLSDRNETEVLGEAIRAVIRLSSDENLKPCCVNHDYLNTLVEACRLRPSLKILTAERVAAYLMDPGMSEMLKSVTSELVQKLIAVDLASKESGEKSFYAKLVDLVPQEELVKSLKDWFGVFIEYRDHDYFWHESLSGADKILLPEKGIILRAFSKNHYFLFQNERPIGFVFATVNRSSGEAYVSIDISDKKDVRHGLGRAIMQWIAGEVASRQPGKEAFVTLYEPATDSSVAFMKKCFKDGIFSRLETAYAQAENSRSLASSVQWIPFSPETSPLPSSQKNISFFIRGAVSPRSEMRGETTVDKHEELLESIQAAIDKNSHLTLSTGKGTSINCLIDTYGTYGSIPPELDMAVNIYPDQKTLYSDPVLWKFLYKEPSHIFVPARSFGRITFIIITINNKSAILIDEVQPSYGYRELIAADKANIRKYSRWNRVLIDHFCQIMKTVGIENVYATTPERAKRILMNNPLAKKGHEASEAQLQRNYHDPFFARWERVRLESYEDHGLRVQLGEEFWHISLKAESHQAEIGSSVSFGAEPLEPEMPAVPVEKRNAIPSQSRAEMRQETENFSRDLFELGAELSPEERNSYLELFSKIKVLAADKVSAEKLEEYLDFSSGKGERPLLALAVLSSATDLPNEMKTLSLARKAAGFLDYQGDHAESIKKAGEKFFRSIPDEQCFKPLERGSEPQISEFTDDAVQDYRGKIAKIPLLTPLGEVKLGVLKSLGDEKARESFIESNLRLVIPIAARYSTLPRASFMDLIMAGNTGAKGDQKSGLVRAVDLWEPQRGLKFSTYAAGWIREGILSYIRSSLRTIRIKSHTINGKVNLFKKACEKANLNPRDWRISSKAIADALSMNEKEVTELREIVRTESTSSLQDPLGEDGDVTLGDIVAQKNDGKDPSESREILEFALEKAFELASKNQQLKAYTLARDKAIVRARLLSRFQLEGGETKEELAKKYKISRQRIHQVETGYLEVVMAMIKKYNLTGENAGDAAMARDFQAWKESVASALPGKTETRRAVTREITDADILERFSKERIEWGFVTREAKQKIIRELARICQKTPDALAKRDFMKPLPEYDGKVVQGLMLWAKRNYGKATDEEAVEALISDMGFKGSKGESLQTQEIQTSGQKDLADSYSQTLSNLSMQEAKPQLEGKKLSGQEILAREPLTSGSRSEMRKPSEGTDAAQPFFMNAVDPRSDHERKKIDESFKVLSKIDRPARVLFVMPMYKEIQRLQPRSMENPSGEGVLENPFGEDALRVKVAQFETLHAANPDFMWKILAVDDGTPGAASAILVKKIWREIQEEYRKSGNSLDPDLVQTLIISPEEKARTGSRKGHAVVKAMKQAVADGWADFIGYTDTDISTNVMQAPLLLEKLMSGKTDAAIGSRWVTGGEAHVGSVSRFLSSKLFNWIIRILLPPLITVQDTQRGFKLFTRNMANVILKHVRDPGLSFDTELLLLTKLAGGKVTEVPIAWFDSSEASTVALTDEAKRMIKGLLKYQSPHLWDLPLQWQLRRDRQSNHRSVSVNVMGSTKRSENRAERDTTASISKTINQMTTEELRRAFRIAYETRKIKRESKLEEWKARDLKKLSAGVFVLRKMNDRWHFLLGQETESKVREWSSPAGGVDAAANQQLESLIVFEDLLKLGIVSKDDQRFNLEGTRESVPAAALRELFEEAGIGPIPMGQLSARIDDFLETKEDKVTKLMNYFLFIDDSVTPEVQKSKEMENFEWIPLNVLLDAEDGKESVAIEQHLNEKYPRVLLRQGLRDEGMRNLKKLFLKTFGKKWEALESQGKLWDKEQLEKSQSMYGSSSEELPNAFGVSLLTALYRDPSFVARLEPLFASLKETQAFKNGKIRLLSKFHNSVYSWRHSQSQPLPELMDRIKSEMDSKLSNAPSLEVKVEGIDVNPSNGKIFLDLGAPTPEYFNLLDKVRSEGVEWTRQDRLSVSLAVIQKELNIEEKKELAAWVRGHSLFSKGEKVSIQTLSLVHHADHQLRTVLEEKIYPLGFSSKAKDLIIVNPKAEPHPKAVMFDLDGTLVNTLPVQEVAFGKMYYWITSARANEPSEAELRPGKQFLHDTMGQLSTHQIGSMIQESRKQGHGEAMLQTVLKSLAQKYKVQTANTGNLVAGFGQIYERVVLAELEKTKIELLPGVREFLEALHRADMPIFIGTGTMMSVPRKIMEQLGVRHYFRDIYGANTEGEDPFPHGKADMLQKIKKDLNLQKDNELLIFGDGRGDMEASKRGGTYFIAVGLTGANEEFSQKLISSGADFLLPDLKNLDVFWKQLGFRVETRKIIDRDTAMVSELRDVSKGAAFDKEIRSELRKAISSEEKEVAAKTTEGVFRQSKVLAMGKTALNGMLASLMPQAYAMAAEEKDYGPFFKDLDTGYGTPVSIVFDKVPDLSSPLMQALAQFLAKNRFVKFYFVIQGAHQPALLKFKKDFEEAVFQKSKKAAPIHVANDTALIPGLMEKGAMDRALIYDTRAEGEKALRGLEPELRRKNLFDQTMRVYDPSSEAQKPAALFATFHEFFGQKKILPEVRSALEILSRNLGIQAVAQKLIEQAA